VLVGGADEQHLIADLAPVAGMNVGRQQRSGQIAEMLDAVDVGQRAGDQRFLGHGPCSWNSRENRQQKRPRKRGPGPIAARIQDASGQPNPSLEAGPRIRAWALQYVMTFTISCGAIIWQPPRIFKWISRNAEARRNTRCALFRPTQQKDAMSPDAENAVELAGAICYRL
jgi:hypothetical protein